MTKINKQENRHELYLHLKYTEFLNRVISSLNTDCIELGKDIYEYCVYFLNLG